MISFRQFTLTEAANAKKFDGLPNIEVTSLDAFAKDETQGAIDGAKTQEESITEDDFGMGAQGRPIGDTELQQFLGRIFDKAANKGKKSDDPAGKRDKYVMPYVHNKLLKKIDGSSFLIKPGSDLVLDTATDKMIDTDDLMKQLTERPKAILSQNAKMVKSGGKDVMYFNFGIPALTGLAVDEKKKQFVIVTTCPGAGACKLFCYALKGGYIQYPDSFKKQTRMLNFLLNDPDGFFKQVNKELAAAKAKFDKKGIQLAIRWHDAGDFFSDEYKDRFYEVARKNPDVQFYAYTKLAHIATGESPNNVILNFSQGAHPTQTKQVDVTKYKNSVVVPKELFADLLVRKQKTGEDGQPLFDKKKGEKVPVMALKFKDEASTEECKRRLAEKYGIKQDSILTYDEMIDTPVGEKNQWNVIVVPGDGDVSASRRDVLGTYLLFH